LNAPSGISGQVLTATKTGSQVPSDAPPQKSRVRRDLFVIGIVVLILCGLILIDPDRFFEWLAKHKEVQIDEFLVAVVIIGTGFGLFSWRRWTDLSRQVSEYKRLQTQLSAISREASLLSETDDLLQSCLSSDEACKVIIRHIASEFRGASGAIWAVNESRSLVEVVAQWGEPAIGESAFDATDCWALRRGRVNISAGSNSQMVCTHLAMERPGYAMCVPMIAQGEILGVLYVDNGRPQAQHPEVPFESLTDSQERMVKTLAEHLALAMSSLRLRETLRIQSIRDPLTNLFNRRYLEETLERELSRATRNEMPLGIMMIDVDYFKRFNDSHGHDAGDAVLRDLAQIFQSQLRAGDIACRYGGEEFTLILIEAPLEAVAARAEQLRQAAANSQVHYQGQTFEPVTLSIGISCYPKNGSATEDLMRAADRALYSAKEAGRNRVVAA
jgi:diguanylate cyclase (GGDEF)-like protein